MSIYTLRIIAAESPKRSKIIAWTLCSCQTYEHITGESIEELMRAFESISPAMVYAFELRYDGIYILDYLLNHGYTYTDDKNPTTNQVNALIAEDGEWYNCRFCFEHRKKKAKKMIELRCASKKLPSTIEDVALSYGIDYTEEDEPEYDYTYKATKSDLRRIKYQAYIIAYAIAYQHSKGLTRLTASSDALNLYKKSIGMSKFRKIFPVIDDEDDKYIRKSIRGGITYVAPEFQNKKMQDIYVYDENSAYPYIMSEQLLPYGIPMRFTGKYKQDEFYPLHISRVEVCCSIKPGRIPSILIKGWISLDNEYLIDTEGKMQELTLTSIDLVNLFEQYEVYDIKYIDGIKFRASSQLFTEHIQPIYQRKCASQGAEKAVNKLLLNGLYGKFISGRRRVRKLPRLQDGIITFENTPATQAEPVYAAVGSFITAYGRLFLCRAIAENAQSFIYCDTDSMHLIGTAHNITIDNSRLGAWKLEKHYISACYMLPKAYYGIKKDGINDIKLSGCSRRVTRRINPEELTPGTVLRMRTPRITAGGLLHYERTFRV